MDDVQFADHLVTRTRCVPIVIAIAPYIRGKREQDREPALSVENS